MRLVRNTDIIEYAQQFWRRERDKQEPNTLDIFEAIYGGADPVAMLKKHHGDKMPRKQNVCISVALITSREEVDSLLVREYAVKDAWMRERGLVPEPLTQKLGELAAMCLQRGYFTSARKDRPIRHFNSWQWRGTAAGLI